MGWQARAGDARELIAQLADHSVDVIITDPPYEIGQTQARGLRWDDHGIAFDVPLWRECLRVLKPGGHLAAFGATKTSWRLAAALDEAGFVIRDQMAWMYASGMVKGLAYDRVFAKTGRPDLAREFAGTHSKLKPAFEPVWLAQAPISEPTMADNVARWGTGTLQVDACRTPTADRLARVPGEPTAVLPLGSRSLPSHDHPGGRFPTNVVLVDDGSAAVDEAVQGLVVTGRAREVAPLFPHVEDVVFYSSKATRAERPVVDGRGHITVKPAGVMRWLVSLLARPGQTVLDPFCGSGTTLQAAVELGCEAIGFDLDPHSIALTGVRMGRLAGAEAA
ncbi:DNA-methyltransferase [Pseudoclavibacter soli]|uniref:DNA-methyltransferase n=1 Tax=Pseudoclavibacter soli TaxID=452623 RepID=UPI00041F98BF|nr:site-specific DNA-methyltransferase [Pseudoclavibacter soli]